MTMARPSAAVPVARSLEDIYPADVLPAQLPRWRALGARFRSLHDGGAPAFVARSPGRVNIIGEHIDYSLYPVLPMAVVADVLIATGWSLPARETGFEIRIDNMDPARFKSRTFTIANVPEGGEEDEEYEVNVGIDATTHEWTNYFKAGLAGALRLLRRWRRDQGVRPMDLRVLVDGTVPPGGGLSSSAALVSASALAVLVANEQGADRNLDEVAIDRRELTELAIVSERAIGVNSGGMDQAASVLSERDAALLVSFYPRLDATPLRLPVTDPPLSFLIAQSFVRSDKYVTGPVNYNLRVVECTLAAACLNAVLNPAETRLPSDASPLGVSLRGFHETYFSARGGRGAGGDEARRGKLGDELEVLIGLVEDTLTSKDGYTRDEIARILGIKVADLESRFIARFPIRAVRFKLRQRALHVFAEALRVQVFVDNLEHAGADLPVKLGQLLIASQESCRELYECSCAEIDTLCEIGLEAGALGSRVTGAGWGGCSVHLVPAHRVKEVRQGWEDKYYRPRLGGLSEAEAAGAVVETRPGSGSAIFVGDI